MLSWGCSNVVLLFPHTVPNVSFKLINSSPDFVVAVMTNFFRMLTRNVFVNVFKSDAVIWWAAIFRTRGRMGEAWTRGEKKVFRGAWRESVTKKVRQQTQDVSYFPKNQTNHTLDHPEVRKNEKLKACNAVQRFPDKEHKKCFRKFLEAQKTNCRSGSSRDRKKKNVVVPGVPSVLIKEMLCRFGIAGVLTKKRCAWSLQETPREAKKQCSRKPTSLKKTSE